MTPLPRTKSRKPTSTLACEKNQVMKGHKAKQNKLITGEIQAQKHN